MTKLTKEDRRYLKQFKDGSIDVMRGGMKRLNAQYRKGKGTSRHNLKKDSGHAQLDIITAEQSWIKHKSAFSVFGKWCKDEGINRFHLVTQDDVERFLYHQESLGRKYKTITGYQTALNHVFVGSGVEGHIEYSAHHLSITADKERKNNLMDRSGKHSLPDRHKYLEQAELMKAAGLRRTELENVGTKSFYKVNDNYYVSTIGKGGKGRYAQVLDYYKDTFKELYSDSIIQVASTDDIPQDKEAILEIQRTQNEWYDKKIPTKYGVHVYRAEYAQEFYKELKENGKHDTEGRHFMLSDEYEGDYGLFRKISKSLGHNRVNTQLMASYLRDQ